MSIFGQGKINNFKDLLVNKLSPQVSSNTFQYWMDKGEKTFDPKGNGLYDTGSTRWALRLSKWVFNVWGITKYVDLLCECETMEEQKRI